MSINKKCPRCGSWRVQLTNERSKHGCLFAIIFGIYYIIYLLFKLIVALLIFLFWDWWITIIKKSQCKSHIWISGRILSGKSKTFYCHNCGHNFKA